MIIIGFLWASLLVLVSFVMTSQLTSIHNLMIAVAWAAGFLIAKTTIVPDDPRQSRPRMLKLSYREYHPWAVDAAQALRRPFYRDVMIKRFKMNRTMLILVTLSAVMHAGMFGWVTLLTVLQAATFAGLVYVIHAPWPWRTLVARALAVGVGLLGGIASGIYYRWIRAWPF